MNQSINHSPPAPLQQPIATGPVSRFATGRATDRPVGFGLWALGFGERRNCIAHKAKANESLPREPYKFLCWVAATVFTCAKKTNENLLRKDNNDKFRRRFLMRLSLFSDTSGLYSTAAVHSLSKRKVHGSNPCKGSHPFFSPPLHFFSTDERRKLFIHSRNKRTDQTPTTLATGGSYCSGWSSKTIQYLYASTGTPCTLYACCLCVIPLTITVSICSLLLSSKSRNRVRESTWSSASLPTECHVTLHYCRSCAKSSPCLCRWTAESTSIP